jgi:hypothetical protein
LGSGRADLTARKSERLKDPFVTESRLLVEFFFFPRAVRLLTLFAGGPIVVHSWSSQLLNPEKLAYPPVLIRVKAVYYTPFLLPISLGRV